MLYLIGMSGEFYLDTAGTSRQYRIVRSGQIDTEEMKQGANKSLRLTQREIVYLRQSQAGEYRGNRIVV
jgi:hypothetical protein